MWKEIYKKSYKGGCVKELISFLIFNILFSNLFAQNIQDYKKMIDETISAQNQFFASGKDFDIRIQRIKGKVNVISAENEEVSLSDTYQYPLDIGDIIKVGFDGEAVIYINNFAAISLMRNTEVSIEDTSVETVIRVFYGAIVAKIEKLMKNQLKIKTPQAVCGVRGTEFAVEHSKLTNESYFGVFDEGEILVWLGEDESDDNKYSVGKGQEIYISPNTKRYKISPLRNLAKYRHNLKFTKRYLLNHKKKWRKFSPAEKIKYRHKLFIGKHNQHNNLKENVSKKKANRGLK